MGWIEICEMLISLHNRNKVGRPNKLSIKDYLIQIQYVLRTGIQWKQLKAELHWSTYYKKFVKWSKMCIFKSAFKTIQKILKCGKYLTESSYKNLFIDSTMIKKLKDMIY